MLSKTLLSGKYKIPFFSSGGAESIISLPPDKALFSPLKSSARVPIAIFPLSESNNTVSLLKSSKSFCGIIITPFAVNGFNSSPAFVFSPFTQKVLFEGIKTILPSRASLSLSAGSMTVGRFFISSSVFGAIGAPSSKTPSPQSLFPLYILI